MKCYIFLLRLNLLFFFYGRLFPILLLLASCFVVNLSGVYHQHNKPIFTEKMFVIPDLKT